MQHLGIVISFKDNRSAPVERGCNIFTTVPDVSYDTDLLPFIVYQIANGVMSIMAFGKGQDLQTAEINLFISCDNLGIMNGDWAVVKSALVQIDGNVIVPRQNSKALDVVAVFMGDKYALDILNVFADFFQPTANLPTAYAGINENLCLIGANIETIA